MNGIDVVVQTPNVSLEWDKDAKCVKIAWRGAFESGEQYRQLLMRLLDVIEEKRGSRMLFDMRNMPVVSPEDQAWVQSQWMPRSIEVGLKYSAVVMPKAAISRLTLRHIAKDASHIDRQRAYFETLEEAREWLKSAPDRA